MPISSHEKKPPRRISRSLHTWFFAVSILAGPLLPTSSGASGPDEERCHWRPEGTVQLPDTVPDQLIFNGVLRNGSLVTNEGTWVLVCAGKVVQLADAPWAKLVLFSGHQLTRYALFRGNRLLEANLDASEVSVLGSLRFKVVEAGRDGKLTQGAYLATPLMVRVAVGRCQLELEAGDSASLAGHRYSVNVCEQRSNISDPHTEPRLCLIRIRAKES
jgi:hypothetical protein